MICSKCGNTIDEGSLFCGYCGTPVEKKDAFEPYGQSTFDNAEQPQEQQPVQPQAEQPVEPPVQQPVTPPVPPVQPQYQQQGYVPPVQPQFQAYQQPFNNNFQIQQEISSARTLGILSIILGILVSSIAGWICGGIGSSKANKHLFAPDIMTRTSAQDAKKLNKIGLILTSVLFVLRLIFIIVYFAIIFGLMTDFGFYY